jgi:hypothetical protein
MVALFLCCSSEVGDLVPASPNALETVSTIAEEEPTPNRLVGTIKEDPKKKTAATPRAAARLTAAELDKAVTISLVETPTFWLLDIGETISLDPFIVMQAVQRAADR